MRNEKAAEHVAARRCALRRRFRDGVVHPCELCIADDERRIRQTSGEGPVREDVARRVSAF